MAHAMPPAIFLMGPTAAGKTGLAIQLRERFPVEIISVDSALVYREMDIGTAKPDAATLARAPHRLIDIRDPAESYSAAEFRNDALREMDQISRSGRVPLLVGGTMLYFRALRQGLARLPPASSEVRRQLEAEAAEMGWERMHQRLEKLDPRAAGRIHPNDPQRIQRALEVMAVSGRRLSDLQEQHQQAGDATFGYRVMGVIVCPEQRTLLHQRIAQRFDMMLEQGFLEEVRRLRRRGDLQSSMPSMRCVGYRQAWAHLDGAYDLDEMVRRAVAATRQLAKRQLTWLRQESGALWYDLGLDGAPQSVFRELAKFLET